MAEGMLARAPAPQRVVADADVTHETVRDERPEGCHCRAGRDERIGEVDLVQVDGDHAKAAQAAPRLPLDDRRKREHGDELRRDDDPLRWPAIAWPTMRSELPKPYISAVSMRVTPSSIARRTMAGATSWA
jgi:hypothetical protein